MNAHSSEKFNRYETTKTFASEGLLHLPYHPAAIDEFRFIRVDGYRISAPTGGPVQTDDIVDSVTWAVDHLTGPSAQAQRQLIDFRGRPVDPNNPFGEFYAARRRQAKPYSPTRGIDRSRRRE